MKHILRISLVSIVLLSTVNAGNAQRVKAAVALGGSGYYGDLSDGFPKFNQLSPAFSLTGSYDLLEKLRGRLTFSMLGVKGDDAWSKDWKHVDRNLNFKSFIWDLNLAAEYDILNSSVFSTVPYVFAGPGIFHFNPYTTDRFGQKQYLQRWGTEGQGLASYPDRKPYSLTQFNIGFGAGLRIDLTEDITLGGEIFIRRTFTDYLDDVSQNTYVDPSLFVTEGNPYTQYLAYRGDELPGGKPFSVVGTSMPRGNPNVKDMFYSFQIRLTYTLSGIHWGGDLDFYGNGGGSARDKVKNPRRIL